jgi:ketosteroid isomerase-like protein
VKRVAYILIASVPLLAATAPSWQSQALASAAPFIDKANSDWSRAIVTGNAAMLSAPYAADAVFIGPDGTAIHSKAGVRTMYARRPAKVQVLNASIKSDGRAAADPNDVYEWGTARLTVKRGKTIVERSARYLTVWHRTGKSWLITRNIAF